MQFFPEILQMFLDGGLHRFLLLNKPASSAGEAEDDEEDEEDEDDEEDPLDIPPDQCALELKVSPNGPRNGWTAARGMTGVRGNAGKHAAIRVGSCDSAFVS